MGNQAGQETSAERNLAGILERVLGELVQESRDTQHRLGEQGQAIRGLVESNEKTAAALDRLVDRLDHRTNALSTELHQKTSTDVYKLGGLVLAVLGALWAFMQYDRTVADQRATRIEHSSQTSVQELNRALDGVRRDITAHQADGHPFTVIAKTDALQSEIERLRERLLAIERSRFTSEDGRRIDEASAAMRERLAAAEARLRAVEESTP